MASQELTVKIWFRHTPFGPPRDRDIIMIEELNSASNQLRLALEHYLHICSSIRGLCQQDATLRRIPLGQKIEKELEFVESYDMIIQQTKVVIKVARNHMFSVAPINSLPNEILAHIFRIVRDEEPCQLRRLASVCSHWRTSALTSPWFWSHIDYNPIPSRRLTSAQLDWVLLQVLRSGKVPLEFHISAQSKSHYGICDKEAQELCELIAPRMASLYFDLEGLYRKSGGEETHRLLTVLLSKCVAGVLTKLVMTHPYGFGFLGTENEINDHAITLKVELDRSALDDILSSVTVLHLTGLFPRWESSAYHGLVDLRLYACSGAPTLVDKNWISESALVNILNASPGLRILYFQFRIIHKSQHVQSRVCLTELEELQLEPGPTSLAFCHVESFLRLIDTGSKPLRLSIRHYGIETGSGHSITETEAFFTRSNVTKLHITELPEIFELLPSLSRLKVLILAGHRRWNPLQPTRNRSRTYPQLNKCLLCECTLPLNSLLELVKRCAVQTITIHMSKFYRDSLSDDVTKKTVKASLLAINSGIKIRTTSITPNLAARRDPFYDY